jgi:hypothetical protein
MSQNWHKSWQKLQITVNMLTFKKYSNHSKLYKMINFSVKTFKIKFVEVILQLY